VTEHRVADLVQLADLRIIEAIEQALSHPTGTPGARQLNWPSSRAGRAKG
jgi:hypothetical protein